MKSQPKVALRQRLNSRVIWMITGSVLATALTGCGPETPKGQVLAIVNKQEVTAQDLNAEARAEGAAATGDVKLLLQRVIARIVLAQEAHTKGLDQTPGYPSELKRIEQTLLAQKLITSTLKPPPPPTPDQLATLISSHPYMFGQRTKVQLSQVALPAGVDVKSLSGLDTLDAITSRLKQLAAPGSESVQSEDKIADTGALDPALAEKLVSEEPGKVFFLQGANVVLAVVVRSVTPMPMPPDQEQALASKLWMQNATQQAVNAQVNQLKKVANIQYQAGYEPPGTPPDKVAPKEAAK